MMEIWEDINGYEGCYQISSFGRAKSLPRNNKHGRILKSGIDSSGYSGIALCKNGQQKSAMVHRLVALHFIPNPDNKPEVNHKNGIKTDNKIDNLEWMTHQENIIHSFKNGFHKPRGGSLNPNAKLSEMQIKKIRLLYATGNYLQREIASKYNCTQSHIDRIVKHKHWKNSGQK